MNNNQNPQRRPGGQQYTNPYTQPGTAKKKSSRRRKKKANVFTVLLTIFIFALIFTGIIFAAIWFSGVRYIKVKVSDDLYVKFLGKVDDEGNPYKGRIIYSDGISADVNLD